MAAPPRQRRTPSLRRVLPAAFLLVAACGPAPPSAATPAPPPASVPPPAPVPWDPALGTATLVVKATHDGERVKVRPISLGSDPGCESQHAAPVLDETVVEGPGGELANVVAWLARAPRGFTFEPVEDPVVFDMEGCVFDPHVVSIGTGQPLWVLNDDRAPHRTRIFDTAEGSSVALPEVYLESGKHRIERIRESGARLMLRDPAHAWMTAWALVFDHPFHGVTGKDGTVALPKVPAGTWTVSVWHEYRRFTRPEPRTVTVRDGETLEVPFVFRDAKARPR